MLSLLILFLAIAILFSFLCSMWEAVLLSVTPAYAQLQMQKGSPLGAQLDAFKTNVDRPLAAILTLNTIAHTVGAIGVGNQAATIWGEANPLITQLLIPAGMTLAILVLSEIIPKTLGALYWERLVPFTVTALRLLVIALSPLVWLSERLTGLLKRDTTGSIFSRHDFVTMAQIGADQGVIDQQESRVIGNLLRLRNVRTRDAMTPRTVVVAARADTPIGQFRVQHPDARFSRIPIYDGSLENVVGYVLRTSILSALLDGRGDEPLRNLSRDIQTFSQDTPLPELFESLLEAREHIAVVFDEFGGMAGVITTEDVIETMLGLEIVDETDSTVDLQALARQMWERRARGMGLSS